MKIAITAIIVCFSALFCSAKNGLTTDVANFSLGKLGATPNLSNSMTHASSASAALLKKSAINFQYRNNYFLPQVGYSNINAVIASKKVNCGLYFSHYGYSVYSEFSGGISFSRFFEPYFAFNVSCEYYGIYLSPDQGVASTAAANLSLLAFPIKQISIGFAVYNVSFSYYKTAGGKQSLPSVFELGFAYNFNSKAQLSIEVAKELKSSLYFGLGVEYMPVKQFTLRLGVQGKGKKLSPSGGFGLQFGVFSLDYGLSYDFDLGLSMAAGIAFRLSK